MRYHIASRDYKYGVPPYCCASILAHEIGKCTAIIYRARMQNPRREFWMVPA